MAKKPVNEPAVQVEEPKYPHIESFAEQAVVDDVVTVFGPLKESLASLKGPRAEAAKKAVRGVERTEELLHHLLEVREKLRADRKAGR
ncbi:MAG: hypothetical protein IPJ65_15930 [Archangiaceae bacterium]|nr:hypothetical protein [Archangiaceae bacterium]